MNTIDTNAAESGAMKKLRNSSFCYRKPSTQLFLTAVSMALPVYRTCCYWFT